MPPAPKPKGKRKVNPKIYQAVQDRDGTCLWGLAYQGKRGGPCGGRLHVHHIIYRGRGGDDEVSNAIVLCADHHAYVHRENIDPHELFDLIGKYSLF